MTNFRLFFWQVFWQKNIAFWAKISSFVANFSVNSPLLGSFYHKILPDKNFWQKGAKATNFDTPTKNIAEQTHNTLIFNRIWGG